MNVGAVYKYPVRSIPKIEEKQKEGEGENSASNPNH